MIKSTINQTDRRYYYSYILDDRDGNSKNILSDVPNDVETG